jgi:hypothetical protein
VKVLLVTMYFPSGGRGARCRRGRRCVDDVPHALGAVGDEVVDEPPITSAEQGEPETGAFEQQAASPRMPPTTTITSYV